MTDQVHCLKSRDLHLFNGIQLQLAHYPTALRTLLRQQSMNIVTFMAFFSLLRAGLGFPLFIAELARRDLIGLLDGLDLPETTSQVGGIPHFASVFASEAREDTASEIHSLPTPTLSPLSNQAKAHPTTSIRQTSTITNSKSFSPVPTAREPTEFTQAQAAAVTSVGASNDSHWKAVGVSVIVVTSVAAMILAVTFFDEWSGFLKDVFIGKTRNGEGAEELLPDWEKSGWEYRLGESGSIRFPNAGSAESIWGAKEDGVVEVNREDEGGYSSSMYPFPRRPEPALTQTSYSTAYPNLR